MNNKNYILHATPQSVSDKIKSDGFFYVKGRPTVTWNVPLVMNHSMRQGYIEKPETEWELWSILCMELPKEKKLKTSVKWNIIIDYQKKEIHGRPPIRMGWKSQWAIYQWWDHHQWKDNILDPKVLDKDILSKENIVLELQWTPELIAIANRLETIVSDLKKINIQEIKKALLAAIKVSIIYQKEWTEIEEVVDKILMSTLQSSCIEFVRSLFLASADNDQYKVYLDKKNKEEKEWDMKQLKSNSYKLIYRFPEYVKIVNEVDFDLFNDVKCENLNRYLKSSINYINKKFWNK